VRVTPPPYVEVCGCPHRSSLRFICRRSTVLTSSRWLLRIAVALNAVTISASDALLVSLLLYAGAPCRRAVHMERHPAAGC
jgi:hypothetical protein